MSENKVLKLIIELKKTFKNNEKISAIKNSIKNNKSININVTNKSDGRTALHWAARNGFIEIVRFLVDNGANINLRDNKGKTPLILATQYNHNTIVDFLLEREDMLCKAMLESCYNKIKRFEYYNRKNINYNNRNNFKNNLKINMKTENKDILINTIQYLIDNNRINIQITDGITIFHIASLIGSKATIERLILAGADINIKDINGMTPFLWAFKVCNISVIKFLLEKYEYLFKDKDIHEYTTLHVACRYGCTKLVEILLNMGVDVNINTKYNTTPLTIASEFGYIDIINLLLDRGANINNQDYMGTTAINMVAKAGKTDIVNLLISRGADIFIKDMYNANILYYACENPNNFELVDFFIKIGIKLKEENNSFRQNCLHKAAISGNINIIKLILEQDSGININEIDILGNTALKYAKDFNNQEVYIYLERMGGI